MFASAEDRFELLREVGKGGFGAVHQARDRLDGSHVAVKVLKAPGSLEQGHFDREVALLSELRHPSIVRYITHGRTLSGQAYLVMEWLEGQTLEGRLSAGRLSIFEVLLLARRVIEGLVVAAQKGVMHRDIKPANLFLPAGNIAETKILDFGLARRVDDSQSLTQTGRVLGTPLYMSPEQARGEHQLDVRTDIFSLGNVLYECLTGAAPFVGATPFATLAKICFDEPARLESTRSGVPARLSALVHAMLSKQPDARPSHAEVSRELERITSDLALQAPGSELESLQLAVTGAVDLAPSPSVNMSLRARGQQRVLCAVFVGRVSTLPPEFDVKLRTLLESYGARCERLLDGSRILMLDRQLGASEQAVAAAHCALGIKQLLPRAPIVVCTGRAIVENKLPFGELIERGALLLVDAAPGVIRVDETSAGLLDARFELRGEEGERYLERERIGGEAPRTLLGQVTPFVGRDRELSQLEIVFQECIEESVARVVLVTAPAGAGKSRLRHEFVQRLHGGSDSFELLVARGDSVRRGTRFGVLTPALRAWAQIAGNEPVEARRDKLRARMGELFPPERASGITDFIGEMIGTPCPDDQASPQLVAARRDPQLMADRVLASWLEWLEALTEQQPVLLLVEDLHWADPASVRFLEAALLGVGERPLLLLAFARPEVRETFPNLWSARDVLELRLPKLGSKACERLLSAIAGHELDAHMQKWLVERADGNPFYLEELLRSVRTRKNDQSLPDSILGMVQMRLDALGEDGKLLLRAASVFGQVFRQDAVQALLGEHAGLDLNGWLQLLSEKEVIFARGASDAREYVFRHALIRDAAYALLPSDERKLGHRLAAEYLEQRDRSEPALLAEHFERGEVFERAAAWYRTAALQAVEAGSLEEVLRFGERSIACGAEGEVLGEVASVMAEALSYSGDEAGAAEWGEAARENLPLGVAAWWRASQVLTLAYLRQGSAELPEVVEQLLEQSAGAALMPEQVIALAFVAGDSLRLVQRDTGLRLLARLPEEFPEHLQGRPEGCVQLARAVLAFSDGDLGEAVRHARSAMGAFRKAGALRDLGEMLHATAFFLGELGLHDQVESCCAELTQLGRRLGFERWVCIGAKNLGLSYLRQGQYERSEAALRESNEGFARLGIPADEAESLVCLALAAAGRGDLEDAAEIAERSVGLAASDPRLHALALAASAQIALLRQQPHEARALASEAMELVSTHALFEHVALVRVAHAESLLACGQTSEADAAIAEAHTWLHERALKIQDVELRRAFMSNIPEHARIAQLEGQRVSLAG